MTDLNTLESDVLAQVAGAADLSALDAVRVAAVGKTGSISGLLKTLGAMSPDERKERGAAINALRDRVQSAITEKKASLEAAELDARLSRETLDLTLPGPYRRKGSVHPTMQVMDEMVSIFADMGFAVAEGPDIEDDFHNFTALNFPEKHPAREMHDTFFFEPKETGERMLLRTHTSPVQVRTMVSQKPPIRIIAPGRTYRCDSDATHTPMFHQVEGLLIDETSTMADLKGTLREFLRAFFGRDFRMMFKPTFFPFVEPGADVVIRWELPDGNSRWLEVLGCGMVHPQVLRNCGIDPERYTGFAFGMGVERLAMLRYGVTDLRAFFENDVRFLRQFA